MMFESISEQPHLLHNIESYVIITLLSIVNTSGFVPRVTCGA